MIWDDFIDFINSQPADKEICHRGNHCVSWGTCAVGEFASQEGDDPNYIALLLEDEAGDSAYTDDNQAIYELLNNSYPATYGELQDIIENGASEFFKEWVTSIE